MTIIEDLKEKARTYEQREDWSGALSQYEKAIDLLEREDRPDISLYNRAGDLYVRVTNHARASEHYERAIELYAESGLLNNSIAVCKKVLRNIPTQYGMFLKMARFRAAQGFLPDARENFLTYAGLMQQDGDLDQAMTALVELSKLMPHDIDLRISLVEQLASHDRTEQAVSLLADGLRLATDVGDGASAQRIEEMLAELDPEEEIRNDLEREAGGADSRPDYYSDDEFPQFDSGAKETDTAAPDTEENVGEIEQTALSDAGEWSAVSEEDEIVDADALVAEEVEGFETGAESAASEDEEDEVEAEEPPPLPTFGYDPHSGGEADAPSDTAAVQSGGPDTDSEPTPSGDEARSWLTESRDALENEDLDAAVEMASKAYEAFSSLGEQDSARDAIRILLPLQPDRIDLRQRLVEYALRSGDSELEIEAYLELGRCLVHTGQAEKARGVYEQVLALDPGNREAVEHLGASAPEEGPASGTRVASSEDYVDLGSMIFDEEGEKTTRWVVAAEEPSGDEAADFKKMLSQFKQKVSQNLAADDLKGHYDLGTAYKEMGLIDEAISEFQQALRASPDHLPTYELLGQCFIDKGQHEVAVKSLNRALELPYEVEDELIGIYYHLACTYEILGRNDQAKEFFEKVFAMDINFCDVTERLRELR